MTTSELQFLDVDGQSGRRRIALIAEPGDGQERAGVMWLAGLKSDMVSTKASALATWARERGIGCTRFDYSGHGRSQGRFEDATIGDWLEEARAVFEFATRGPQVLIGSSTGAYVALLLLRQLIREAPEQAARIPALVLIAPAWDLTEDLMRKAFPEDARRAILEQGVWRRPSAYDPQGYAITRQFIEEGRRHLIADAPFDPGRPVVVLQGLLDVDVPPAHARRLATLLPGGHVAIHEVADGDHRLSRPRDLELLFATVARLI